MFVRRGDKSEREKQSAQKREREAERKWQTWPEERKGAFEKDNPWETARWTRCPVSTLLLLPPSVLCHGYQTGLPMQPVNVFFSSRSELGTNVSQSVSCTINVNCPGMHKHMKGAESQGTPSHPGRESGRESERGPRHFYLFTWKLLQLRRFVKQSGRWRSFICANITCWSLLHWSEMFISHFWLGEQKCILLYAAYVPQDKRTQLIMFLKNPSQYLLVSHGI